MTIPGTGIDGTAATGSAKTAITPASSTPAASSAVPLVVERGAGAELRTPLGIAIIGGLVLRQVLTLFTTPVIYLALDRLRPRPAPLADPAE